MKITNVTCEAMRQPISVTAAHPVFSWKIESDKKDVYQKSSRMRQ